MIICMNIKTMKSCGRPRPPTDDHNRHTCVNRGIWVFYGKKENYLLYVYLMGSKISLEIAPHTTITQN